MWEDDGNKMGGKFSLKLKKDYTTIIWEELILAFIGNIFPENVRDEICGIVVSVRKEFNLLQLWIRNSSNSELILEIEYINYFKYFYRNVFRELIQIPSIIDLEFKSFFKQYDTLFKNLKFIKFIKLEQYLKKCLKQGT